MGEANHVGIPEARFEDLDFVVALPMVRVQEGARVPADNPRGLSFYLWDVRVQENAEFKRVR